MEKLKYAYYPGCASQEITKEADATTRRVCKMLGIELHDMPSANCCGAGLITDYDHLLYLSLNARIFAKAETMGMDIMTICSTCLMVMNRARAELDEDAKLLEEVNAILAKAGLHYSGNIKVKQFLWVLVDDLGLDKLKAKVTRPLKGLNAAAFYGCHSLRPSKVLGFDDPERPTSLEAVIETLGGNSVKYKGRTKCCGFQADLVNLDSAVGMTTMRLLDAKGSGAEVVVTPCPFCHINLDNYQSMAEKSAKEKIDLPIFHLAQVVGLALGLNAAELGLSRHLVSSKGLLKGLA